jgi:hypothetical protein
LCCRKLPTTDAVAVAAAAAAATTTSHTGQLSGLAEAEDRRAIGVPFVLPKNTTKEQAEADPERAHALASKERERQGPGSSTGQGWECYSCWCYCGLVRVVFVVTPQ